MRSPDYRDFPAAAIPIAGHALGVAGAMQREVTDPLLLDIELEAGAHFSQPLPARHNAFLRVGRGTMLIAGTRVPAQRMAILANDPAADGVVLQAGDPGGRAILVDGAPLNEPIAQYGPFVMNTREQIFQAVDDFRRGVLA